MFSQTISFSLLIACLLTPLLADQAVEPLSAKTSKLKQAASEKFDFKDGASRASWVAYRNNRSQKEKWYEKMDIGPAWANSFGDYYQGKSRVGAIKGLRMELSMEDNINGLFDTETLSFSGAYQGGVYWAATPWTGRHGSLVSLANKTSTIFQNTKKPGWADKNGSFAETREFPGNGNLAEDHGRYRGYFRHGNRTILDYTVLGSRVLEMPTGKTSDGLPMAFRQFDLAPCEHDRVLLAADHTGSLVSINKDKKSATLLTPVTSKKTTPPASTSGKATIVMDRTENGWETLSMGAPSNKDAVDLKANQGAYFRVVPGFLATHAKGGDEEGVAVRLNDGLAARSANDLEQSYFFEEVKKNGRLELNLAATKSISRIHLFSSHHDNRATQNVEIYGSPDEHADPTLAPKELKKGGWEPITTYNTRKLGGGGKHGVAIVAPKNKFIGNFRKLLFVCKSNHHRGKTHTYFSEIDVYGEKAPTLKAYAHKFQNNPLTGVLVKGKGITLRSDVNGQLTLHIPASKKATRFSLGYTSAEANDARFAIKALQSATPLPQELLSLTKGGPTLYPETVATPSSISSDNDTWTVDQISLPVENPWHANMRVAGFDFFSGGDSAALSTWNGDVWIVKGLNGDWKDISWRRYATGLFEAFGLKIEDNKVYVRGRDQITRLHDQNNDGEADWYECFNNDILVTKNFHEFAFSLQTDKEGNFYFTKGTPVRAGGRGFEKILPHHGTVVKVSKDGKKFEVLATGLRAPGGVTIGPNGEITTSENEGTWQPACKLNYFTSKDKFLGVEDAAHHLKGQKMHLPLCYLPMRIDNSGGEQVWVPENSKWGFRPGELIHLSYGRSTLHRVLKEEVDGTIQGGVVRIPVKLKSSAMRARFHPDGSLYVLGFRGWQTNAATPQAFERIRYNNKAITIPDQLRTTDKGIYIRFEKELEPNSVADRFNFKVERWKYIRSKQYGSGEFSIDNPDLEAEKTAYIKESRGNQKHDQVEVIKSLLLADKKTVFLHIPSMKLAEQMSIGYTLKFADQTEAHGEVINTIHKLSPHQNASELATTQSETVKLTNLQPGLIQKITTGAKTDYRVSRLPAQYVSQGDAISDMLSPGEFTSEWSGFLKIKGRITPQFSLQGRGTASLLINGEEVLKASGNGSEFAKSLSKAIQLDPGTHRFTLKYKSGTELGQIRVLWQTNTTPRQSIPAMYFVHEPNKDLSHALAFRQGRDLLLQQNCIQCHVSSNTKNLPEHLEKGPDMKGIASRIKPSWIAQWLAKPHTLKPGTTMPAFVDPKTKKGRQDAADMASYLALLTTYEKAKAAPSADPLQAKLGGAQFHALGCVACHTLPDATAKKGDTRTPLNHISSKFTEDSLVKYLSKPDRHYPASKMPDFQLNMEEASQLSAFLITASQGKELPHATLPKGDAVRGKRLVTSHNCAACHNDLEKPSNKLPDFNSILGSNWLEKGCVSQKTSSETPHFNLTIEQRELLEKYRVNSQGHALETLSHTSAHDYSNRQFKALNCMACHDQDEQLSLLSNLHTESQALMKGVPVDDRHKIDQTRPQLTYIGEMLHTDYMQRMLDGSVKQRPRPWLAMRMPAFHSRAKLLAEGLSKQHGMAPSYPKFDKIDAAKSKVGEKLIGSNGGFACTICHANGDAKATAAFEVEGINFSQVALRLRPGYYHKWMENPQSITPTTKMPRYTTGNKSPLPDLDHDAQKQFEAILEHFRSLEKE